MRVFRRFDNLNKILEINEVTSTTLKSTRYYRNQKGCFDKISSYTCNLKDQQYLATRAKCLKKLKEDEDWHTAVVLGLI